MHIYIAVKKFLPLSYFPLYINNSNHHNISTQQQPKFSLGMLLCIGIRVSIIFLCSGAVTSSQRVSSSHAEEAENDGACSQTDY